MVRNATNTKTNKSHQNEKKKKETNKQNKNEQRNEETEKEDKVTN